MAAWQSPKLSVVVQVHVDTPDYAGLAQLEEQSPCKRSVVSSSLTSSTRLAGLTELAYVLVLETKS